MGHSLGGAAVLSAAPDIPSARAVATIGAPADPEHVTHVLDGDLDAVRRDGSGTVTIAGRTFTITDEFLRELDVATPTARLAQFRGAVLLMHAPRDQTVGLDNAEVLYHAARHPKSFVSLDDADHLVSKADDATYVASVVAAWAHRYLPPMTPEQQAGDYAEHGATAVNDGGFLTRVDNRGFPQVVDEPADMGGTQQGPTPYDYLATALASCTVMTMRAYAERKKWEVGEMAATVTHARVHVDDCADCEAGEGYVERFERVLRLPDGLSDDQVSSLVRIADRCPVHRTLEGQVEVHTRTAD